MERRQDDQRPNGWQAHHFTFFLREIHTHDLDTVESELVDGVHRLEDAVLGSVKFKADNKRGIEVDSDEPGIDEPGFIIIIVEAKIGSELSPGVTNSPNYNQRHGISLVSQS